MPLPAPISRSSVHASGCPGCADAPTRGHPAPFECGRRDFLKCAARAVLLVEASGLPWTDLFAPPVRAAEPPAGIVRVALADFPALASISGSVHLLVTAPPPGIYPVILTRTDTETFAAVSSQCTHAGCVVNTYSEAEGVLLCTCHGSRFTPEGAVVSGLAGFDLAAYPARLVNAGVVEVEIPGIGFATAGALVNTAAGRRMRLSFPTLSGLRYEVKRRASPTAPAVVVPFSLTETGTPGQTVLNGDGATATVYVAAEEPTSFLSVTRY